jgi:tetratricopeptide (TPR) repeat protein
MLVKEQAFWQNQIKEKTGYRDAYFSLAIVDYRLNDFQESLKNVEKSLEIDPSFKDGTELKKIIEEK